MTVRATTIGVFLAISAYLLALSIARPASDVNDQIVFNCLSLVFLSCACIVVVARRSYSRFGLRELELAPWWIAFFGLSFGVTSLGWITTSSAPNLSSRLVLPASIPLAVQAAIIAMVMMTAGFLSGPLPLLFRWLRGTVRWATPGNSWALRSSSIPVVIYLAGFLARQVRIAGSRYGYLGDGAQALSSPSSLNQVLSLIEQCTRYALALAVLDALLLSRSARARRTLSFLVLVELGFGVASGVKSELIYTLVALGIAYTVVRGEVSRRAMTLVVIGMLLIVPLNLAYRRAIVDATSSGHSAVGQVQRVPQIAFDAYTGKSVGGTLAGSTEFASSRLREIDNLALVMQRSPSDIPFRSPTELVQSSITGLIPRVIWRSKPIVSSGYQFSQEYYNLPSGLLTASAVTIPGDLYRHGGWWVLILGMGLFGKVLRAVSDTCSPRSDPRRVVFYVGLFLILTNLESDVTVLAISLIETVLIAMCLTRFAFVSGESAGLTPSVGSRPVLRTGRKGSTR